MENTELQAIMKKRETAQAQLKKSVASLEGVNPMSLMMGGGNVSGVLAQLESVLYQNDLVITELAERALSHGD